MSSQPNKSLIDGLACLQELASNREPIGCRELARRLDMNVTRVNRLLMTLAQIGLARRDEKRRYLPGPGIHVLAAQSLFGSNLIQEAVPVLEEMGRRSSMVALGMLWRDQVSYLYHSMNGLQGSQALGRVGLYPASRSSIGLALLASKTDQEVEKLYEGKEIVRFPKGISSLLAELKVIRKRGYVHLGPEASRSGHNVAVTVGDPAIAAVCYGKLPEGTDIEQAAAELKIQAARIKL